MPSRDKSPSTPERFTPARPARTSLGRASDKAFSLVEAVLSSFLLLTAVSMCVWLFDASLQAEAGNDRRVLATMVAQDRLEEIRAAADASFGAGLASFNDVRSTSQGLEVHTRAQYIKLYTPCSRLETQYPLAAVFPSPGPKALERSCWQVEVTVSWGHRAADRVTLASLVGDWRKADFTVRITPNATQRVAPRGTMQYTCVAEDGLGNRLYDLVFSWYVNPLDGMGTISQVSRDGQVCLYKNHFRNFDGRYTVQPGKCEIECRAVYRGQEKTAKVEVENEK